MMNSTEKVEAEKTVGKSDRSQRIVWNKNRLPDQLFFVATFHQFLKRQLRDFCKANILTVRGTKEDIVKRIWEYNFDFEDVKEFLDNNSKPKNENKKIHLVERIYLRKSAQLRYLCHTSKNLYNEANYLIKTAYEKKGKWIRYNDLYHILKNSKNYKALPSQTGQQILRRLDANWKSYFRAKNEWIMEPSKFDSKPEPPKYKPRSGENLLIFTNQQCHIKYNKAAKGFELIFPNKTSLLPIKVNGDRVQRLRQVRILPKRINYLLEIVYEKEVKKADLDRTRMIGIDLGLRNLVVVVNNIGLRPWLVKGGPVKSINQYFNKKKATLQKIYANNGIKYKTNRLCKLIQIRDNRITDIFHKTTRAIISYCAANNIGTIVVGYNKGWKHQINLGKRNNQNFVNVPFLKLVNQIKYKAELMGIQIILIEESHTSKCSFLDNEEIKHHENYMGTRGIYRKINDPWFQSKTKRQGKVCHGLFKAKTGRIINSDVNGAYNILKKAFPNAFPDGIEELGISPYSIKISELSQIINLNTTIKGIPKAINGGRDRG